MRKPQGISAGLLLLALALSVNLAGPTYCIAAGVTESAAVATAEKFAQLVQTGKFEESRQFFDATMAGALPTEQLSNTWIGLIAAHGACKSVDAAPRIEPQGTYTVVYIPRQFGSTALDLQVVINTQNKVSGFFIVPHVSGYKEPDYARAESYSEKPVQVGTGAQALNATWTVPKGTGMFPAVVLVHGSGPQDRDETIGTNKPFRDLAHGLASQGIAVLRYEKRTRQHPTSIDINSITVKEETVDDAVEAAKTAASLAGADPKRIYVLGHSLGGMLLPRIAAAAKTLAGCICMAGTSRPLEEVLLEQYEYLATIPGADGQATAKMLPTLRQQLGRVQSKTLSATTPPQELPLHVPGSYWLDLRGYFPADEMAKVKIPVLFLQGGRDYQVTADGDLATWKQLLKNPATSPQLYTFKLYPELNHLFAAGKGKAKPSEYMARSANVDEQVVNDIAAWIKAH